MSVEQARLHYHEITTPPETSDEIPPSIVKNVIRRKRIPVKEDKR